MNTLSPCYGYQFHTKPMPKFTTRKSARSRDRNSICIYGKLYRETDGSISSSSSALHCSNQSNMMNVIDQCRVGTPFPSLFELLLLDIFSLNSKNSSVGESRLVNSGSDTDVIIVGAGVAGSALAHTLGKDGRRVRVIERDLTEPDRIVGEFLLPGGYLTLIELGLEDCVEKIDAQRIFGLAFFKDRKSSRLSFPLEKFSTNVSGWCFHNGRFVQRMREKAAVLPNVQLEQGTVTSLIEENGTIKGVKYKIKNGQELDAYAPLTIVCDGCFSKLRRSLCNSKVYVPSCFVAFILENCHLPYANHGHIILADPSLIALYPISNTEIRCYVDIPGQKLPSIANGEMASYLKTVVAPKIPPGLHDAFISAIDKGNFRTMPNRCMPPDPRPTPGAMLLGDAFNMRNAVSGLGMAMALSDIVVLRDLLRPLQNLNDPSSLCKYLESLYTLREPLAFTRNIAAAVLYEVLSAYPDEGRMELRQACFDSLSIGDNFLAGIMAFLAGLDSNPLTIPLNFYVLALYSLARLQLPFPSIKGTWDGARLTLVTFDMIFHIIEVEAAGKMLFPVSVPAYLADANNT